MTKPVKIKASDILTLLKERHSEDVCVPECKDGPTQTTNHRRLDLWVFKRSWSPVTMYGYEIKVSRSDFLKDDKWPSYLDLCNHFYFVCPYGLIEPDEVPEGAGLMWVAKTGSRIYTKKKAARREIEPPVSLLLYVLMARIVVKRPGIQPVDKESYWRKWVAQKAEKKRLGYDVKKAIREYVETVELENKRLKRAVNDLNMIKERLIELGFKPDVSIPSVWGIDRQLQQLKAAFPQDVLKVLESAHVKLGELLFRVNEEIGNNKLVTDDIRRRS
jgi:hypothetical protein